MVSHPNSSFWRHLERKKLSYGYGMVGLEPVTLRLPIAWVLQPLGYQLFSWWQSWGKHEEEGEVTGLLDTAGGRVE